METFDWIPLANPQARYQHNTFRARFGNGYIQAAGSGINSRYDEWPLTFQGSRAMVEDIQNFLDRHQGFRPFRWFPPIGAGAGLYDADEYTVSPGAGGCANYTLSVTFRLRKRMYAPTYSVPPVVSGLHQIGQVITVSQGTWQSENPMQFEYQWLRNGEPIAGATDQNYTLVDDDLFEMISVRVTASSLGGSTSVETDPVRARLDSVVSWLYSDIDDTVFVDPAGTVPAVIGDPVGLIKDSSGNGNDFTQPTVTARPILGRVPRGGRRNTVTNSTLQGSGYSNLGSNVSATLAGDGPRGSAVQLSRTAAGSGYYVYTQPVSEAWENGETYLTTIAIKNIDAVQTRLRNIGLGYEFVVNWSDPEASGLIPVDGWPDWYLLERTFVAPDPQEVSNRRVYIYPEFSNALSSGSVIVSGLQVEVGEETTPYQNVASTYDITESGVPDVHYLNFDGTDDLVSTELPAIENGTLVIAGTEGIWIDDDYNFDGGTFSIGTTSYTNGPEGILTAIGDPIVGGSLVINRQLTQRERELVIKEMKERGAPGVFELGPEEVGDPGYDDPEYWNLSGSVEILNSRAIFTEAATGTFTRTPSSLLTTGATYLVTASVITASSYGNLRLQVGSGPSVSYGPNINSPGIHRAVLTLGEGSDRSAGPIVGSGPKSAELESFSVRKLELIP